MEKCEECSKTFKSLLALKSHSWKMHTEEGKKWKENNPVYNGKLKPWNKGLTKESSEIIRQTIKNNKKLYENGYLTPSFKGKKHTEETKRKIAKSRAKYLSENPDKHVWKRSSKFRSVPCEKVKEALRKNNIFFVEEWQPLKDKSYSIDIAFPEIKLGVEVNGNQHYNSDGALLPYYQKRHDLIESSGWKLIELHYAACFNEGKVLEMLGELMFSMK